MTKRRVFSNLRRLYVNLLLTGGPMRDLHRVKFIGKGRDFSPLDGKIRTLLCQCLRSYVCEYVELYFQEGEPLLCHGITKRGFQPLHIAKTAFCIIR